MCDWTQNKWYRTSPCYRIREYGMNYIDNLYGILLSCYESLRRTCFRYFSAWKCMICHFFDSHSYFIFFFFSFSKMKWKSEHITVLILSWIRGFSFIAYLNDWLITQITEFASILMVPKCLWQIKMTQIFNLSCFIDDLCTDRRSHYCPKFKFK